MLRKPAGSPTARRIETPARMSQITSRRNPLVARCRELAHDPTTDEVLLDGFHLVSEASAAGLDVRHAIVAQEALGRIEIRRLIDRLTARGTNVGLATSTVMDAVSPVRSASDIVAIASRPASDLERVYAPGVPLVLVAADVQDPGNLGAMVRVAEAGGASGVIAAGAAASPWSWKALRGSMGSSFRLPIATCERPADAVEDARRRGCRIVATVPRDGRSHFDADLVGPIAIMIGGEGPGLSGEIVEAADLRVAIPMKTPVESLNAAVAAALLIYEAYRQRIR
jgi:RNA methyltransferase, TrmH family